MKACNTYSSGFAQCDTEDISPLKKQIPSIARNLPSRQSQLSTQPQSKKTSLTQQQIYSHDLIRSIMNKRFKNTVKHNVGQFDNQVKLYAKTQKQLSNHGQMQFSNQKQMYQSEYTKRVNDFNRRLNQAKSLSQRVEQKKQSNIVKTTLSNRTKNKRPSSAGQSTKSQSVHKKISVSGLVSYNFNSINARKNLGFDFEHDDEKLSKIMMKLEQRNKCCSTRQHSMVQKKQKQKANRAYEIKKAIFSDFETKTGVFLQNLHEQILEQDTIYGFKWSKLICIKQMMEKQKVGYEEAEAIVNQIEARKQELKMNKKQKKMERNDELQLQMRKQVVKKGKVMVKQLYFVD